MKNYKRMKLNQENQENMDMFKKKLEEEFNALIANGEDVRCYLYFPHEYLTDNIKCYLDEFLMDEAYREIETEKIALNSFIVYQDSLITVKLEKKEQRMELLERLLKYFEKKQEFEKCAKVHSLLKQLLN